MIVNKKKCCKESNESDKFYKKETNIFKGLSNKIRCEKFQEGCKELLDISTLKFHEEFCEYQPYYCSNTGCNVQGLLLKDKSKHEEECPYNLISCKECSAVMLHKEYKIHLEKTCIINFLSCIYCSENIENILSKSHLISCSKNTKRITCKFCQVSYFGNHNCITELKNTIIKETEKNNEMNQVLKKEISNLKDQIMIQKSEILKLLENEKISKDIISTIETKYYDSLSENKKYYQNLIEENKKELQVSIDDRIKKLEHHYDSLKFQLKNEMGNEISDKLKVDILNQDFFKEELKNFNSKILELSAIIYEKIGKIEKNFEEVKNHMESKINEIEYKIDKFKANYYDNNQLVDVKKLKQDEKPENVEIQINNMINQTQTIIIKLFIGSIVESLKLICQKLNYTFIDLKLLFESKEEIIKNQYLYYVEEFNENSRDLLHLKNFVSRDCFKIDLYSSNTLNHHNDAAYHKGLIFSCGGYTNSNKKYLDLCAIVDVNTLITTFNIHLTEPKDRVSLLSTSKFLICIGGCNGNDLNTCEYFDIKQNLWVRTASLNRPNRRITSYCHEGDLIFAIGGMEKNAVERLNLKLDPFIKWELIYIPNSCTRLYGSAFQLNSFEILIFGGSVAPKEFFLLNLKKMEFIKSKQGFVFNYEFNSSKPIYFDGFIWVVCQSLKKVYKILPMSLEFEEIEADF